MSHATSTQPALPPGVRIDAPRVAGQDEILTVEALEFIVRLSRLFTPRLVQLLQRRREVQAQLDAGLNHRVFPQAVAALHGVDFRAVLAAIEQPVLIVNGSKDRIFVDQEDSFMAVARQATRHRFENCEHGVSIRRSAEFAALITRALSSTGSARPSWLSPVVRCTTEPPIWYMPASKLTRVRVLAFSKIIASVRSAKGW